MTSAHINKKILDFLFSLMAEDYEFVFFHPLVTENWEVLE